MREVHVNGVKLAYEARGAGEPVLLVHGALVADAFVPLVDQPALEGFRLIRYHRRGYGRSGPLDDLSATTMGDQAADAMALLDHLGLDRAHVVAQSSGGAMALEAGSRYPHRLSSLALLEPVVPAPSLPQLGEWIGTVVEQYHPEDADRAVRLFLGGVGDRADALDVIELTTPGGIDQVVRDAATFFEGEFPASATWSFGPEEASRITCPVLSVVGSESTGIWAEGRALLHEWFPHCRDADIQGVDHLLQMADPTAVAEALAGFFTTAAMRPAAAASADHR